MDTSTAYRDMPKASAAARLKIRRGEITGSTSGLAPGYVQGNLCILPRDYADEFLLFCQRNPKPCPILGVSDVGKSKMPAMGEDFDLATDAPRYCVYRDGELVDQPTDVSDLWRDDLVGFVIGCSFSFEEALIADGMRIKHMEQGTKVPMFLTSIPTAPAGRFSGNMVVSMRPFAPADAIRAVQITTRFPTVHGAPVHIGLPELIGVHDLQKPDFGEPVPVADNELPVFWACGVTPQAAIRNARPPLCITHAPGCMVVTDLKNTALAVL